MGREGPEPQADAEADVLAGQSLGELDLIARRAGLEGRDGMLLEGVCLPHEEDGLAFFIDKAVCEEGELGVVPAIVAVSAAEVSLFVEGS